jgi:biopolymer transport protein ExbB/TolQ
MTARSVVLLPVLVSIAALASAGDGSELERVERALAQARADLDRETGRADAARAEATAIVSAATLRRDRASARLEAARDEKAALSAREAALRPEIERLTPAVEAQEVELSSTRDVLRRLLTDRTEGAGPGREEAARLLARLEEPARLAEVSRDLLERAVAEARAAERPAFSNGEANVEPVGRVRGRLLRWGPSAWFLGDGVEAVLPLSAGKSEKKLQRCDSHDVARAFAALDRGDRRVELPIVARRDAARESAALHVARLVQKGGITMIPLALLSILSVFTILERLLARASAVRRVRATLATAGDPRALADDARSRLLVELRRRLWILGTVGSSAPFVGLLGTVIGIVRAFEDMAGSGSAGFAVVAAGIAEALVATAAGIVVAVVAVIAYNALQAAATSAAEALAAEIERGAAREARP